MSFWLERRVFIAVALSILALTEIVDLTIVAVALPDIMGALGANINEISIAITSYIVAAAIFIPLTGLISRKFGEKNTILVSTAIFGIASILCGLSTNLVEMVIFRILQGIGGAFLPALAQGYIAKNFANEEQQKIMTLYTLCVVLGPVIGPVLGGVITENMSWHWIFFVNIPICICGFVLILLLMHQGDRDRNVKIDYTSFIFLLIGAGCFEFFLDEGSSHDWFESSILLIMFIFSLIAIGFFIWRGVLDYKTRRSNPNATSISVVDFGVFTSHNFVISCLLVFCFVVGMVIALAYFPTLLQRGYGYPVDTAGYISSPRGLSAFFAAPIFILLGRMFNKRYLMMLSICLSIISSFMLSQYEINCNQVFVVATMILQGIGLTGTFVLLMQYVFMGINKNLVNDASGVFNFFRNIANSVGTAIAANLITTQQQVSWNDLASKIDLYNTNLANWVSTITGRIYQDQRAIFDYNQQSKMLSLISQEINLQSFIIANIDIAYMTIGIFFAIILLPLALRDKV